MLNINPVCKSPSFGTLGITLPDNANRETQIKFDLAHEFFIRIQEANKSVCTITPDPLEIGERAKFPEKNYSFFTVSLTDKPVFLLKNLNEFSSIIEDNPTILEHKKKRNTELNTVINDALEKEKKWAEIIEKRIGLDVEEKFDVVDKPIEKIKEPDEIKRNVFTPRLRTLLCEALK